MATPSQAHSSHVEKQMPISELPMIHAAKLQPKWSAAIRLRSSGSWINFAFRLIRLENAPRLDAVIIVERGKTGSLRWPGLCRENWPRSPWQTGH